MSYYILPKTSNIMYVSPTYSTETCVPYVTFSLLNYFCKLKIQIDAMCNEDKCISFEEYITFVNPYEFVFTKIPGSKLSVSKLKPKTNLFYDLIEILHNVSLFNDEHSITSLHISPNYLDSIESTAMFREGSEDCVMYRENMNIDENFNDIKVDFIFYETNVDNYIYSLIEALLLILKNQKKGGNCIIKINHIFYKPIVDILYFLSSLYEKVYINKPCTNNITSFDRYIICKNFQKDDTHATYVKNNYLKLYVFLKKMDNRYVKQVLNMDVPYYFKNKIDDINIIVGQKQLESLDQIITICKNKNKNDKIENIKKNNIQKSVIWCEKYKIPCNKFIEKVNIFLPTIEDV